MLESINSSSSTFSKKKKTNPVNKKTPRDHISLIC